VLFLATATRPPLGADTWVHAQIIAGLDRSAHEVHAACVFHTPSGSTPTYDVLRNIPDLQLFHVHLGRELQTRRGPGRLWELLRSAPAVLGFFRLVRYVRRCDIDLVHTSDRPRDAVAAVLLSWLTGTRAIVHSHVAWGTWMSSPLRWALRHADANFAVSAFVADSLIQSGNDAARTYVILNGIDPAKWHPRASRSEVRAELGVNGDTPVVTSVCRLFPSKGPAELIRAFADVATHGPARLLIVGQEMIPGYAAELTALAGDLGVADRVQLLGRRPDIERLLGATDIYAMPSIGEPCAIAYLEAMAMALPIVALDSGGAPEQIVHGVTGLLSPPGDAAALADHLRTLLDDPALRTALGARARDRLEAQFTTPRMAREIELAYDAVVCQSITNVLDIKDDQNELLS
jgi:glycosyltransferase involved in cell wall biosynthesis